MRRTVLVTGASGGLGRTIAQAFALAGDGVAWCCHARRDLADTCCSAVRRQGGQATVFAADITDEKQVERLFTAVEKELGPVDVLVNCAGIQQQKMFCDTTLEDWQNMMAVHVTGTYLCSRRALGHMVHQKRGCIVNVSSMWGQVGASCEVAYSSAKAAVIGMTRALAKEVAPSGIRVNCVAPGAIDAGMMEGFPPADKAALSEEIPQGRLGTPQEVAAAVIFLASEEASYITGQVLGVNGGYIV